MRRAALAGVASMVLATTGSIGAGAAAPPASPTNPAAPGGVMAAPAPQPPMLSWGGCDDDVDDEFECATLTVPLDYFNQAGPSIGIALIRLPAESGRQGAILLNPGGPGGSGYDFAANTAIDIDHEFGLDRHFDLIGFDPRGVDRSGAIDCLDDAQLDAIMYLDDTPDNTVEREALHAASTTFDDACRERYGDTLAMYSTENVAKDMEWIRWAIGDEQISFIGVSYGTYLGAVYATLFPNQVRAMVLDSALVPSAGNNFDSHSDGIEGFEEAFGEWAAWCGTTSSCAFTGTNVPGRWYTLLATLDRTPITADDGRAVNQVVMRTATLQAMYDERAWPLLAAALSDAEHRDGTALLELADEYNERNDDGTYQSIAQSNPVIACASGFGDGCSGLFTGPVDLVVPSYTGPAPILVVGGVHDSITPLSGARRLAGLLGPRATLLSYSGQGHGYLLLAECVDDAEAGVIRDLTLPASGTECGPDPDVPRPAFWDDIPVPDGVGAAVDNPAIDSALGLDPSRVYSDTWILAGNPDDVVAAYDDALGANGFDTYPVIDNDGYPILPITAPDGSYMVVALFTADVLASDPSFAAVAGQLPAGLGIVVVLMNPELDE